MKDNKNKYQIVVVLNPKIEEKEKDSLIKKIEAQVELTGAEIVNKDHAGLKELAYEIQKFSKGDFWIFEVESEKTLKTTGEKVLCKMKFYVYKVEIDNKNSNEIEIRLGDDLVKIKWVGLGELGSYKLTPPSVKLFTKLKYLK